MSRPCFGAAGSGSASKSSGNLFHFEILGWIRIRSRDISQWLVSVYFTSLVLLPDLGLAPVTCGCLVFHLLALKFWYAGRERVGFVDFYFVIYKNVLDCKQSTRKLDQNCYKFIQIKHALQHIYSLFPYFGRKFSISETIKLFFCQFLS